MVMLRSFDLENHHENLKQQEDNPFDYFLQFLESLSPMQLHQTNLIEFSGITGLT
jgi:hypothetical protein